MKSFKEMREEAWEVATTRWSYRMITVMFLYFAIAAVIFGTIAWYFRENEIVTWGQFEKSRQVAEQSGLELTPPSMHQVWSMTWASSFSGFLQMLFQSLFVFGMISFALRAIRNRSEGWLRSAFGGFKAPLGMLWLNALMSMRIVLWALLFIIPGIIAAFRYAVAWYVKSEHPDFSASQCLAESGRLMKGHKFELFLFGLSYIGWIFLAFLGVGAASAVGRVFPAVWVLTMPLALAFLIFVFIYMVFGQAVFYTEVKRLSEKSETEADI